MNRVKLVTCKMCDPTFFKRCNNCEACTLWAGCRDAYNYRVSECIDICDILRKPALTMIKTWHPDSISLSERQRALMMTSDLTLVWEDQNSWIHLKLGCWSWIPFPELSEESASFCIPRQGLYFTNNLHLDSVVLLVGLSKKSYVLSFTRCSQDMV